MLFLTVFELFKSPPAKSPFLGILDHFLGRSRVILGSLGDHFGIVLASFSGRFGVVLTPFWAFFGPFSLAFGHFYGRLFFGDVL